MTTGVHDQGGSPPPAATLPLHTRSGGETLLGVLHLPAGPGPHPGRRSEVTIVWADHAYDGPLVTWACAVLSPRPIKGASCAAGTSPASCASSTVSAGDHVCQQTLDRELA